MYHVPLALQCIYGRSDEGDENGDVEQGREWRLPGLLYADEVYVGECAGRPRKRGGLIPLGSA